MVWKSRSSSAALNRTKGTRGAISFFQTSAVDRPTFGRLRRVSSSKSLR